MAFSGSAIQQLQQMALDPSCSLSNILRFALSIAVKLGLEDFEGWLQKELNGYEYDADIPTYRRIKGEAKALNPINGWIPMLFEDSNFLEKISNRSIGMAIGEIENLQSNLTNHSKFKMHFDPRTEVSLMENMGISMKPALFIPSTTPISILEAVRNKVLDWGLSLEKEGVEGERLEFTEAEKKAAAHITYNIEQVGILGNIGDNSTAHVSQNLELTSKALKEILQLAISIQSEKAKFPDEIKDEMADLSTQLIAEVDKKSPDKVKITSTLQSIKNISEGVTGNLTAQGIISVISSIF